MGFKDFAQNDIEKVFINSNEFAEVHNLNGTQCYAVAEGLTDKQHVESWARILRVDLRYDYSTRGQAGFT